MVIINNGNNLPTGKLHFHKVKTSLGTNFTFAIGENFTFPYI